MSSARILVLTSLAMLAFAGNSLLCRIALKHTGIDPAGFTTIRLLSGGGNWLSALALFACAAGFFFAYASLPAAQGPPPAVPADRL